MYICTLLMLKILESEFEHMKGGNHYKTVAEVIGHNVNMCRLVNYCRSSNYKL